MKTLFIGCACVLVAGTALAASVTVGGTNTYCAYPFRGCWGVDSVRSQGLVLSSDAVPAGPISRWEWYTYTGSAGTYYNFKLSCCHTKRTTLTSNFATNYGGNTPVLVYSKSSQYIAATPNVWFGFDFDTPFNYNGSSNLIMEVDWSTDSGGYAYCRANSVSQRFAYQYNGGSVYVQSYLHYQRITVGGSTGVAPTSLGRVKSLYHWTLSG